MRNFIKWKTSFIGDTVLRIISDPQKLVLVGRTYKGKTRVNEKSDDESFGMLFVAYIISFTKELHSEMGKIVMVDGLGDNWTYPLIQPKLFEEAKKRGYL